jgi:hypothetical protein
MQDKKYTKSLDAFRGLSSSAKAEVLREVYERETEQCRDGLILVFTTKLLVFEADEEDDTVSVSEGDVKTLRKYRSFKKSRLGSWKQLIGKAFGWGWITVDQQGYCDGILLSFDGITPNILFEVIASTIEISSVVPFDEKGVRNSAPQLKRRNHSRPI